MLREFFKDESIFAGILVSIILFLVLWTSDMIFSKPHYFNAVVIEKYYEASKSGVGTGVGVNSNGGISTVVISTYEPQTFTFAAKKESAIIFVKSNQKIFANKNIGDSIQCYTDYGLFTNIQYGTFTK